MVTYKRLYKFYFYNIVTLYLLTTPKCIISCLCRISGTFDNFICIK